MKIVASLNAINNPKEVAQILTQLKSLGVQVQVLHVIVKESEERVIILHIPEPAGSEEETVFVLADTASTLPPEVVKSALKKSGFKGVTFSLKSLLKSQKRVTKTREYGSLHNPEDLFLDEPLGGRLLFVLIIMIIVVGVYYSF